MTEKTGYQEKLSRVIFYVVIYCCLDLGKAGFHNVGTARKITVPYKSKRK